MLKLKFKIQETKAKLGISERKLSALLGKDETYLCRVMRSGLSTARQNELCRELDIVANGGKVLTDTQIIAELTQKLSEAQDYAQDRSRLLDKVDSENDRLRHELSEAQRYQDNSRKVYQKEKAKLKNERWFGLAMVVVIAILSTMLWVK